MRLQSMVFSTRRLLLAALLVVAAVLWTRINKPVEGEVLLELTRRHGVTTADLLSVLMLAMAVVIAWPSRRRPEPRREPDAPRVAAPPPSAPRNAPAPGPTRPVPGTPPPPPRR
ncbi:hypothetical protein ACFPK1_20865 [Actinomycetospora rhizophila]|uniref:Uncharacterized protein n=1 Tax=Actinomycetospora rhizophila TaxID=1416876 RepID=A0ABV9ZK83_9PSEU